jgi:dienelactone hydrolase
MSKRAERDVHIAAGPVSLAGDLVRPDGAHGLVLFAHGSGSSRKSPRNRSVAAMLQEAGFATLLMDLLTLEEEHDERAGARRRFDTGLLAGRLGGATDWATTHADTAGLPIGYFGASTGAAAALVAAAQRPGDIRAVVSRGGRPDLAGTALRQVTAPTLLIVGSLDDVVIELNRAAQARLGGEARLEIVPGATHLFEERGALEEVARLARDWFQRHLGRRTAAA